MEYSSLKNLPYYSELEPLVSGMGYNLVELKVVPQNESMHVSVVITGKDASSNIGINDCTKVHRVILLKIQALLGTEDVFMEVTSPGMERNIKNAAEFSLFIGKEIRVWDKTVTEWIRGILISADEKSLVLQTLTDTAKPAQTDNLTISYNTIAKAKFIYQ